MLRAAVVIGNNSAKSCFEGFPGVVQRVQCYPGGQDQGKGKDGVAFVFLRNALPPGFCIPGKDLADVNDAVRAASPVNPVYLGSADYLEYRPPS